MAKKAAAKRRPAKKTTPAKAAPKIRPGDVVPEDVAELFRKHAKYLAAGRANYAKADKALDEILKQCEPGVAVNFPGKGKTPPVNLTLVDQFVDKNSVWSGSATKRFKLDPVKVKPQDTPPAAE